VVLNNDVSDMTVGEGYDCSISYQICSPGSELAMSKRLNRVSSRLYGLIEGN